MYRVDNSTAVPHASGVPTPQAAGPNPNGYFTRGNPGSGIPATVVDDDWLNATQEEIAAVIEAFGLALSKTSRSQLLNTIMSFPGKNAQYFSVSGTFNVPSYVSKVWVEVWGGGGGASATAGSSGAAGGYASGPVVVTPGGSVTVTVGAAGVGNATPGSATGGGTSSFGASISATGGAPGASGPGLGGNGTGGQLNINGQPGQDLDGSLSSAVGGNAPRGGLGGNVNAANVGLAPSPPGAGGGSNANGGFQSGAAGGVLVIW